MLLTKATYSEFRDMSQLGDQHLEPGGQHQPLLHYPAPKQKPYSVEALLFQFIYKVVPQSIGLTSLKHFL